jgi:hypothetical protein
MARSPNPPQRLPDNDVIAYSRKTISHAKETCAESRVVRDRSVRLIDSTRRFLAALRTVSRRRFEPRHP